MSGIHQYIPYAELNEEQRKIADSKDWKKRCSAVNLGYGLDKLIADPDTIVRRFVAMVGTDEMRDVLSNDTSMLVRIEVAEHGSDKQRDMLLNDPDPLVRAAVAEYGNKEQCSRLAYDTNLRVRQTACTRLANKEFTARKNHTIANVAKSAKERSIEYSKSNKPQLRDKKRSHSL